VRPRFITLTNVSGNRILVNVDTIVLVVSIDGGSSIRFIDGNYGSVIESFEQVATLIEHV
jgi:hypothetical protein